VKFVVKLLRNRKGAALVEYGLLIAGVALVTVAAVAVFGHKTNDMVAATASVLPGAHEADNGPILSGSIVETTDARTGDPIAVDIDAIQDGTGESRLSDNMGVDVVDLVDDADE
jgi:Flp pilus assembly pilin Flp